jgi:RNA polymerase sigma-70 factor (ECF subfamily)
MQALTISQARSHRSLNIAVPEILERTPAAMADRPLSTLTDERLMEMIQSQGHNGLDQLHVRYATPLKGMIMTMLHSDADAEEVLQDVFLEIWNRAANYNPLKGRPLSWIATLTRRRSIDRLRRKEAYRRLQERFAEETNSRSDSWTHIHEDLAQFELNAHLQRAMDKLPQAQQKAIKLAYHHQMSQREIATHTGIPLGTIKTRLELGRRKLAASLGRFEDLLWAGDPARSRDIKPRKLRPSREASPITL